MPRDKLPDAERKDSELRIRLTAAERELLDEAAEQSLGDGPMPARGFTSSWARDTLLAIATGKAKIVERKRR